MIARVDAASTTSVFAAASKTHHAEMSDQLVSMRLGCVRCAQQVQAAVLAALGIAVSWFACRDAPYTPVPHHTHLQPAPGALQAAALPGPLCSRAGPVSPQGLCTHRPQHCGSPGSRSPGSRNQRHGRSSPCCRCCRSSGAACCCGTGAGARRARTHQRVRCVASCSSCCRTASLLPPTLEPAGLL